MDKLNDHFIAPQAAPIVLLGVPFDNVTTAEAVQMIEQMIHSGRPHYLATANADFLAQAARDVELHRILLDAHLILCDGTPLVWASKLLGNSLPERVAGSDIVPLLLKISAEKGYRPFLLGASQDSLESAVKRAQEQHPTLEFAGYYSPPFNRLMEMDHDEIRDRIARADPDILFVGFGCPKQEKWINMHYRSLGVPVSVGIGGTIDFLAGKTARAPRWVQQAGVEWIFRLAQEPRRLFKRYAADLCHFGTGIAGQMWNLRRPRAPRRTQIAATTQQGVSFRVIQMPARLDCDEVHARLTTVENMISAEQACILDLQNVEFIDSTGIGLLIRLQKRARSVARPLILADASDTVTRVLALMHLTEFFISVPSVIAAEAYLKEAERFSTVSLRTDAGSHLPALVWAGELTASNAEEVWFQTMNHIAARSLVQKTIEIDLGKLRFIDSAGLSVMIRARKQGARQGMNIRFINCQPAVLNVIRLSHLENYLHNE